MKNRDRVRALVAVAKESPTSSAVHVDTIMGGSKGRRKKRRKPILMDVELEKGKFSSRSEAGRYAANMRWKGQGKQDQTASPKGSKESSTVRLLVDQRADSISSVKRAFSEKTLSGIGAYLRGEKYEWQKGKEVNPDAKDATKEDIQFGKQTIKEIIEFETPLLDQAEKAIRDYDNKRADFPTTKKILSSLKRQFTKEANKTEAKQRETNNYPTGRSDNTVRSMTYHTKVVHFEFMADRIDGALASISAYEKGKGNYPLYDVGKSKKQVRKDLDKWFKENWVDISRPKEGGGFEPCGRNDASSGKYPKCVPASKAAKMSAEEISSAVRRKRKAESTETRVGKKPINVPTEVEKASKNVPVNSELYAKVKAEAKQKFDVYPSAYANGWLVQEYKRRGGKYEIKKASFGSRSEAGRYAANMRWQDHINRAVIAGAQIRGKIIADSKNGETKKPNIAQRMKDYFTTLPDNLSTEERAAVARRRANENFVDNTNVEAISLPSGKTVILQNGKIKTTKSPSGGRKSQKPRLSWSNNLEEVMDRYGDRTKAHSVGKAESPAWQTKEGKNPKGGLNAKGRASYKRETGGTLKPPVKRGDNPRRASFLARMGNMPGPERDANGEPTRLLLSLQAWGASSKADARLKAKAISARNNPQK